MEDRYLSSEDVRHWLNDDVTKEYFKWVKSHRDDANSMVHGALEQYELNEAALHNAGMSAFSEVLEIPSRMIEDKGGEEDE